MYHKIETTPDMTIRTVQNPFTTVQLFHEYRLPDKPEILNICKMFTTLNNKIYNLTTATRMLATLA
jgi:hypothetical protein